MLIYRRQQMRKISSVPAVQTQACPDISASNYLYPGEHIKSQNRQGPLINIKD